jgi:hypothetical protein
VGADTDVERIIRWLIATIVLCYDPLAIAFTAANRDGDQPPPKTTFGPQDTSIAALVTRSRGTAARGQWTKPLAR